MGWDMDGAGEPQIWGSPETTQQAPLCMGRDSAKRQRSTSQCPAGPSPNLVQNCPTCWP